MSRTIMRAAALLLALFAASSLSAFDWGLTIDNSSTLEIGEWTDNDTEVAAAYLSWRMRSGDTLKSALENALDDLDGFYTFVVGTSDGFAVLRDPVACKPAVMAETDQYVAFGSEYRALVNLPGIEDARVWEPEPATVYFWER